MKEVFGEWGLDILSSFYPPLDSLIRLFHKRKIAKDSGTVQVIENSLHTKLDVSYISFNLKQSFYVV